MRIAVSRAPGAERVVTPLELFFDLVYVFAIGQLSHHLLEHVGLRTGAETAIMTLAVAYAWYMVAWGANWLDPARPPVRLLLVGLMFASLLMSAAIPDAFDGRAWLFVTGYLLIQIGRTLFLIVALRGRALGEHFVNELVWEVLTGGLWIAGAISDGDARLVLWGTAVVATHAGTWALHWLPGRGRAVDLANTEIAGGHLVERFRLFFIIALGETVLTMGTAFTAEPFELERLLALAIGFTGTVALWWCYFHRAEPIGVELAERAEDAGAVGWLGTWTLTLMVLALIAIAVGDEMAIAHPDDDATLGFTLLTFGGPVLFLLAQVFFLREALGHVPRSRPAGVVALTILAVVTAPLTLIVGIAASTAVLVAVAVADTVHDDEQAPRCENLRIAQRYQRPGWFTTHVFNRAVATLTRLGLSVAGSRVLEVRGRKTGEPRRTPVNLLIIDGTRYLVAPRGHTQWVRNLRARGEGRLLLGRRAETFTAVELPDDDKLPILRAYLKRWMWEVGAFFDGVGPDSADDEIRRIAPDHPIFRINPSS